MKNWHSSFKKTPQKLTYNDANSHYSLRHRPPFPTVSLQVRQQTSSCPSPPSASAPHSFAVRPPSGDTKPHSSQKLPRRSRHSAVLPKFAAATDKGNG